MISMDKRYRTRDDRKTRVICVDAKSTNPVFALVEEPNGSETLRSYRENGHRNPEGRESCLDLIEIPEFEFDWSCLPKWANWITKDRGSERWYWWECKPLGGVDGGYYQVQDLFGKIPAEYAPRYHGSDPAPIFQRPTEEGA